MFGSSKKRDTLELEDEHTFDSGVAVLEPGPAPAIPSVAVMERAKSVITPFENDSDLGALNDEIARLNREDKSLFGIEAEAAVAIRNKMSELQGKQKKARAFERFTGAKLRLSNEVLTWRKPMPLYIGEYAIPQPEVGLFALERNTLVLRSEWARHGEWVPGLPPKITRLYEDVYLKLGAISSSGNPFSRATVCISAAFSGVIPLETKEKIREASASKVFSSIRVLAETEWAVDVFPNPYYADPIVVGLVEDEMWVIDVFDPTPLEDYIAKEFTT